MNEYYKKNRKNYSDYSVKIIIGASHVSKLIGTSKLFKAEGLLVRDIAKRSGAPQIKIMSEKHDKNKECIIKIMGNI